MSLLWLVSRCRAGLDRRLRRSTSGGRTRAGRLAAALDDLLLVHVLLGQLLELLVPGGDERLALARLELRLELVHGLVERRDGVVVEHVRLAKGVEDLRVATQVVEQLGLEAQ